MNIIIRPYKLQSESARLIRDKIKKLLNIKNVLISDLNKFNPKSFTINWGFGGPLHGGKVLVNNPRSVNRAINKLHAFDMMNGIVPIPEYAQSQDIARRWSEEGNKVYCRTIINGKEGRGIVVATTPEQVVNAPLYTKRFPNGREYRVHVAFGNVIHTIQKKRRRDARNADPLIRSNGNWVFARNIGHEVPVCVTKSAVDAIAALGLDFGGVDIVYSVGDNKCAVLEVNTAPGLDNQTALCYANAFVEQVKKAGN